MYFSVFLFSFFLLQLKLEDTSPMNVSALVGQRWLIGFITFVNLPSSSISSVYLLSHSFCATAPHQIVIQSLSRLILWIRRDSSVDLTDAPIGEHPPCHLASARGVRSKRRPAEKSSGKEQSLWFSPPNTEDPHE